MSDGPQQPRPVPAILLIILANCLIPVVDTMAKVLVQREYSVSEVIWSRYVFHLVPLLACMPFVGWKRLMVSRRLGLQIGRAVVLATGTGLFIQAISLVPLAEAYAVSFVSPLILTGLAAWWLRESVGVDQWLAVGIGLVGVLIILQPTTGAVFQPAMLLPVGMATCWAVFQVATRSLSFTDGAWTTLFYTGVVGVVGFSPTAAAAWRTPDTGGDLSLLAALGIVGLCSHILIINAFRLAPASILAPFVYVQLIFGILFGFFLFEERVDLMSCLGMALIAITGLYCLCRESTVRGRNNICNTGNSGNGVADSSPCRADRRRNRAYSNRNRADNTADGFPGSGRSDGFGDGSGRAGNGGGNGPGQDCRCLRH